jgi:hypothetical protein
MSKKKEDNLKRGWILSGKWKNKIIKWRDFVDSTFPHYFMPLARDTSLFFSVKSSPTLNITKELSTERFLFFTSIWGFSLWVLFMFHFPHLPNLPIYERENLIKFFSLIYINTMIMTICLSRYEAVETKMSGNEGSNVTYNRKKWMIFFYYPLEEEKEGEEKKHHKNPYEFFIS